MQEGSAVGWDMVSMYRPIPVQERLFALYIVFIVCVLLVISVRLIISTRRLEKDTSARASVLDRCDGWVATVKRLMVLTLLLAAFIFVYGVAGDARSIVEQKGPQSIRVLAWGFADRATVLAVGLFVAIIAHASATVFETVLGRHRRQQRYLTDSRRDTGQALTSAAKAVICGVPGD